MLEGFLRVEGGDQMFLFARLFSVGGRDGENSRNPTGRGMLFSLWRPSSEDFKITRSCSPWCANLVGVCLVLAMILEELARHAHISIHHGNTKCGTVVEPEGIEELTRLGLVKPETVMRHANLSDDQPGVRIQGVPIGSV